MNCVTRACVLRLVAGLDPAVVKHASSLFNTVRSCVNKRGSKTEDAWLLATCISVVQKTLGGRDDIDIAYVYETFTNQKYDNDEVLSRELKCLAAADWRPVPGMLMA